jgi:anti-sigma28 factor (negative regulator of flagellin synthesis)
MSIQIHNDGLAGAGASGTGRAQELSRATTGGGHPASGSGGVGEDQVSISAISSSISSQGSDRAARVQQLAAAYQGGHYQVNATEVSRAMVNHALQAGSVDGDQS